MQFMLCFLFFISPLSFAQLGFCVLKHYTEQNSVSVNVDIHCWDLNQESNQKLFMKTVIQGHYYFETIMKNTECRTVSFNIIVSTYCFLLLAISLLRSRLQESTQKGLMEHQKPIGSQKQQNNIGKISYLLMVKTLISNWPAQCFFKFCRCKYFTVAGEVIG